MEPSSSIPFMSTTEEQEDTIPIIIRSLHDGNHIQDIMQL